MPSTQIAQIDHSLSRTDPSCKKNDGQDWPDRQDENLIGTVAVHSGTLLNRESVRAVVVILSILQILSIVFLQFGCAPGQCAVAGSEWRRHRD
jgi:hypothetical protein